MVKKKGTTKKKTTRKRKTTTKKKPQASPLDPTVSKIMIENFISLQRVLTTLSTKTENLTTQIAKLLELFEISAKALADREFEIEKDNKETLEKLNTLLDQNKTLARGLSLMHERIPAEQFPHPTTIPTQPLPPQPPQLPQTPPLSQPTQPNYMKEVSPQPMFPAPKMSFQNPTKKQSTQEMPNQSPNIPSIMETPTNQNNDQEDFMIKEDEDKAPPQL